MKRIVLGLSDGVDSSVAAYILKSQGYDVLGVYLTNAGEAEKEAARRNAQEVGIDLEALDICALLDEKVCKTFMRGYLAGRTPSPCPGCNRRVKLETLLRRADELGADEIATGHYVRKQGEALYMGDESCDQSYMLGLISRDQLQRLVLPLGDYRKTEVRAMAEELNLKSAHRPDSRENCFIRDMDYASYIRQSMAGEIPGRGEVFFNGDVFDEHEGVYAYTVGQRWKKDWNGRRLYVSRIDSERNRIELCLWEELFTKEVDIGEINLLCDLPQNTPVDARIRVRHTRWETPECRLIIQGSTAHAVTAQPLRAPARGQIAALYMGSRLIGGGVVESVAADYPLKGEAWKMH